MTKGIVGVSVILAVFCLVVFSTPLVASDIEDNLTYQGNKARITVGTIKSKAGDCSPDMAAAVGEMLSTSLVNTGRFIVLASQEEVGELADEINLAQSGYVEQGKGPEAGLMEGADLLITGAVTSFEPDAGGGGGGLGGLTKKALGNVGVSTKKAKIALDIKLIDIRTRRVLKAKTIKAESKQWATDLSGSTWTEDVSLDGALGVYANEPMEDAVRAALTKTVTLVSEEVPEEYYRYTGQGQYTQHYGGETAPATPPAQAGATASAAATPATSAATSQAEPPAAPVAEDMTLYTKYDFVPGDKVIFYDDLANEEVGEFPFRWKLVRGVYEIVKLGPDFWIMATDNGTIRPNIPDAPLPPKYTVEQEFYDNGPDKSGNYFYIQWVDDGGRVIGECGVYSGQSTWLALKGKTYADKPLTERLTKGVHTLRVMATDRSVKMYVDQERVANVPNIEGFNPVGFQLHHRPYNDPENPTLMRHFRFAEGGKSMRDQLVENGRIVTHGILFDPGSATIKGESYRTLKDIGELLNEDPTLRLCIDGHTDSDGADDYNMTLSQNRAESVRQYLVANYGIAADRLECKGYGESKPIDTNSSSEGRANNRRVELVKL
ncbi:OmpA family protein [bacterium]|nr:OmpA family protein [bacterium]